MGLIGTLFSFVSGQKIQSAQVNQNFTDIKSAFNTSAVLTDTAKTITAAHTFSGQETFTGGTTVTGSIVTGLTYSVTHPTYGAKGDGTTDDRLAIFNADAAAIGAVTFPAGTYRIASTLAFTKPVILSPGAILKRDAGVVVTFGAAVYAGMGQCFDNTDLTGRFLFTAGTMDLVRPEWWGAKADGTTDSTKAIQAAVDASIYGGARCIVKGGAGRYKTTDTIHLGYGDTFTSVVFEGHGYVYGGSSAFNGTAFVPTQTDRPTINVQGGRGTVVRGVSGLGKLDTYIFAQGLGNTTPLIDDTLASNWDDPGLGGATLDSRYAPYAFITIDAYSGVQPGTHYPTVTYPGWSGIGAQYGKAASSDTLIENWMAQGFTVPIVVQPSDFDGNGDFTNIRRGNIYACKYGISVGNTQSRAVALDDVKIALWHTALVDNKHGKQSGRFGGAIKNLDASSGIQIMDFASVYPGPISFVNLYAEGLWRLGLMASTSTSAQSFVFEGGSLDLSGQSDLRGYPAYLLAPTDTGGGASPVDVKFNGVSIINYKSVCVFGHDGTSFDGCYLIPTSARTNPYEQFAHNALAGGAIMPKLVTPRGRSRFRFTQFNLDTSAAGNTLMTDKVLSSSRPFGVCWYAEQVAALNETYDDLGRPPVRTQALDIAGSFSSITLVNGVLTATFTSWAAWQFAQTGGLPGDILFHRASGSVFFIRSQTGTTIIAELQNNYKLVGGVKTVINATSMAAGTIDLRHARLYTPSRYLRGDLTAASAVITNVGRDDGFATFIDTDLVVGDVLIVQDTRDNFHDATSADITARTSAGPTITLSGAATRTQVRRRLDWFGRLGPANV